MNSVKSTDEWRTIIETARASGLSDRAWCMANDVPTSSFYYNVKRLRMQACAVPEHKRELLPVASQSVVPVEIIDEPLDHDHLETNATTCTNNTSVIPDQKALINISINGMSISISDRASGDQIKAVFAALGGSLC